MITSTRKRSSIKKSLISEYFPQHLTQNTHQLLLLSNAILNSKLKKENSSTHQKPVNGTAEIPLFKILINSQESQITIKTLCNDLEIIQNNSNFQYVIQGFTKFMNECADKTLKHKKRPMKNKRHSKPWYNETWKH